MKEMSEFLRTQREHLDSSMSQNLANHCRKLLRHHTQIEDLMQRIAGNKRTSKSKLEVLADSSTSPKRNKIDENDSDMAISEEKESVITDSSLSTGRVSSEVVSSTDLSSKLSVAPDTRDTPSNASRITTAPSLASASYSNTEWQKDKRRSLQSNQVHRGTPERNVDSSESQSVCRNTPENTDKLFYTTSSGVQGGVSSVRETPINEIQQPVNQSCGPAILMCPGNIFILTDGNTLLSQIVPQSVTAAPFSSVQNVISTVPVSVTYKQVDSRTSTAEAGPSPSCAGTNCVLSVNPESSVPQHSNRGSNLATLPISEALPLDQPQNVTTLPLQRHDSYLFLPQPLQIPQEYHHSTPMKISRCHPDVSVEDSHFGEDTISHLSHHHHHHQDVSNQILQDVYQASQNHQIVSDQISDYYHDISNQECEDHHDISNQTYPCPQKLSAHTSEHSETLQGRNHFISRNAETQTPLLQQNNRIHQMESTELSDEYRKINSAWVSEVSSTRKIPNSAGSAAVLDGLHVPNFGRRSELGENLHPVSLSLTDGTVRLCPTTSLTKTNLLCHKKSRHLPRATFRSMQGSDIETTTKSAVRQNDISTSGSHGKTSLQGFSHYHTEGAAPTLAATLSSHHQQPGSHGSTGCTQECWQVLDLSPRVQLSSQTSEADAERDINNNFYTGSSEYVRSSLTWNGPDQNVGRCRGDNLSDKTYTDTRSWMHKATSENEHRDGSRSAPSLNVRAESANSFVWRPWRENC